MAFSKRTLLLVLILLLHVAVWLLMKPVWPFSDDYCYAYHADQLNRHGLVFSGNEFQERIGVYLPVSFFFRCFGVNPYSVALWPLLVSLLSIALCYLFVRKIADEVSALITAFLVSINLLQITYSVALFPDIFIALYSGAAVFILYHGREYSGRRIFPFLFVLMLYAGIMTKETILLIVPFIILVLVSDLRAKRHLRFWKRSGLFFLLFAVVFFLQYYLLTGNAFHRISFIANARLTDRKSIDFMLSAYEHNLLKLISGELPLIFILLFSISTILTIRKYDLSEAKVFISVYTMAVILTIIAGYFFYKHGELFLMDRVWMLLIAPMTVLSAFFIRNVHQHFCVVLIVLLCLLVWYGFGISLQRGTLFSAFLILTLLTYYFSRKNQRWRYLLLLPFIAMSAYFLYNNSNYRAGSVQSGNLVKEQIEKLNEGETKIVLTGKDLAENHIIYNDFNEYPNLQFRSFDSYPQSANQLNLFCIVNEEEEDTPAFISNESWETIFREVALSVYRKKP
jgi:4-amino-4-deoxy-L-arabinose transferase-like glycosyltransferase